MFENILLEQEQIDLLVALVEAARNLPRDQRRKFECALASKGLLVMHPGLPDRILEVYESDVKILIDQTLILPDYGQRGRLSWFDIHPLGFKYYEYLKQRAGQPVQRFETTIRDYLAADRFQKKYPEAYQKWADAEGMLWGSDSERQFTTIGHLCREATQEFADALVEQYQPPNVSKEKKKL